ncbi:MAG: SGNH/GDSL hydrolase family protein [Chloroflexi bacterium]|nr:MAG: SGNH/GDSL hydrolase family protein [Chloroflexota bacterium]
MADDPLRLSTPDAAPALAVGGVMIALGDSISAGIGASHASQGCLALVARRLGDGARGPRFVNLSLPGESSHSMLAPRGQLDRAEALIAQSVAAGMTVAPISVCIGGNDAMEAQLLGDDRAIAELGRNLTIVLGRLAEVLPAGHPRLGEVACVQTFYNPFETENGANGHGPGADLMAPRRARRAGFNTAIRTAAAEAGVRVADVSRLFRGRATELTWVRSGDIHPNDDGHHAIADLYLEVCGWA